MEIVEREDPFLPLLIANIEDGRYYFYKFSPGLVDANEENPIKITRLFKAEHTIPASALMIKYVSSHEGDIIEREYQEQGIFDNYVFSIIDEPIDNNVNTTNIPDEESFIQMADKKMYGGRKTRKRKRRKRRRKTRLKTRCTIS